MRHIKSKSVILFLSTLLIAISLFFTSCDNFMNAGDIRKEIEDTIAYNNAQSCDVSFKMDSEKMGEFLGTTQKTLHKGYEVEVQFEINILEYHFETLEAVSYTDKSVSRKDCVKFTELERNDTKGKYKYKIELLEKADDILIRPVCKELPKIFEFAPLPSNTTYPQDTSIKFTFTKPVNKESFTPADCISIYADDDLNSYFNFAEPVFSNDNKTLYIHTKPDVHILAPNGDKTIQTIHVSYDFSTVKDTDEMSVGIQGSFDYKINTSFTGEQKVSVWLPDNTQLGTVGSFAYPGSKSCVVKYSVDFQFNMNQQSYTFMGFEAKSYDDPSVSLDQYVTFTEIDYNDQTGIYKASLKVNENCSSILVNPVCKALPAVTKYTPETLEAQSSNTPIVITFNMPMEEADAAQTLFTKDNISLIYTDSAGNNTDMRDYFEAPVFDSTKQILTIVPKIFADPAKKDIEQFILRDKKVPYADINVSFSENIVVKEVDRQGNKLALKQDSKSKFAVRYKADIEQIAPAKVDFFVSASEITFANAATFAAANKFTEDPLSDIEDNDEKILQNRTKGEIWIYGKYYDKDSGVKTVYVTEKRTNDVSGNEVSEQEQITTYSIVKTNGASFKTDTNGNTEFIIPYNTKSEGGALAVSIAVEDACYNHEDLQDKGVVVIKDDKAYSGFIELKNTKDDITTITYDEKFFNESEGETEKCFEKLVYKNCILSNDVLTIKCEYLDKDGILQSLGFTDFTQKEYSDCYDYSHGMGGDEWFVYYTIPYCEFELTGLDEESIQEKTIRIVVTDDLGNRKVNEYTFPKKAAPTHIREYPGSSSYYEITFANLIDEDQISLFATKYSNESVKEIYNNYPGKYNKYMIRKSMCDPESSDGCHDFYAVYNRKGLYGPKSNTFNPEELPALPNVNTITLADTPVVYTSCPLQTGKTDVTVYIDEDSWTQGYEENYFDRIFIVYKITNYGDDFGSTQEFEQGQCSTTIQLDTEVLYDKSNLYSISMQVFGEKDGFVSDGTAIAIEEFEGTDTVHDNMPPAGTGFSIKGKYTSEQRIRYRVDGSTTSGTVYCYTPIFDRENNLFHSAQIFTRENESGLASAIVNVPGTNKSYTYNLTNKLLDFVKDEDGSSPDVAFIPEWDLDAEQIKRIGSYNYEVFDVSLTLNDNNGNTYTGTREVQRKILPNLINPEVIEGSGDTDWECNFETEDIGEEYWRFEARLYNLLKNEGKYKWTSDKYKDDIYQYGEYQKTMTYNNTFSSLNKGSVYMGLLTVTNSYSGIAETNYNPLYVVVDTPSSGKYDYILPVSGTKKAVLVSSDSTTFVHTLVTKKPYEECKTWDESKWEKNRRRIGEDILSFSEDDHSPQKYKIPVTEMDSGDCYCVIAHFADGSTAMSEVMQNP